MLLNWQEVPYFILSSSSICVVIFFFFFDLKKWSLYPAGDIRDVLTVAD